MSYFNISIEELNKLQKKIENMAVNCTNMSEILTISKEIDEVIKIKA